MNLLTSVAQRQLRDDIPEFGPGEKERTQLFQGIVLQRRGHDISASFTVRKISSGIGVERIFPLHSPMIAKIERLRAGRVRRAKLFYLRKLKGKAARIREHL